MHVVGMVAGVSQTHRPATRETNAPIPTLLQQRMMRIRHRQLFDVGFDRFDDRPSQVPDHWVDAREQRSVGLSATPDRLIKILAFCDVQRPKESSQFSAWR